MYKNDSFFESLCEEYYEKILKYIFFKLKDSEASRDIVQEVFLIAYEKVNLLSSHPNPGGFLFQTAKNVLRQTKKESYKKFMIEVNETAIERVNNAGDDVNNVLDKNIDVTRFIEPVLQDLTEDKLQLYNLRYIQNKSMEEIAELLNIESTAVRMRFVRLRREICERVKQISEENFVL